MGGTGCSIVWFNHLKQMEKNYQILTFDYPMEINNDEAYGDMFPKPITPTPELVNIILPFPALRIMGRTSFDSLNAPK